MAKTIEVTAAQVNAARLLVKQATARGESIPPAVSALANATPVAGQRQAVGHPAEQSTSAPTNNGAVDGRNGRAAAPSRASQPSRPRFAG
jgi:hypothetical protein